MTTARKSKAWERGYNFMYVHTYFVHIAQLQTAPTNLQRWQLLTTKFERSPGLFSRPTLAEQSSVGQRRLK